jgi:hypothetical protein
MNSKRILAVRSTDSTAIWKRLQIRRASLAWCLTQLWARQETSLIVRKRRSGTFRFDCSTSWQIPLTHLWFYPSRWALPSITLRRIPPRAERGQASRAKPTGSWQSDYSCEPEPRRTTMQYGSRGRGEGSDHAVNGAAILRCAWYSHGARRTPDFRGATLRDCF